MICNENRVERVKRMSINGTTLADILRHIEGVEVLGGVQVKATGITYDSRKVTAGDIYVCIPGFKLDGHDYAKEAVNAGAVALVVERFLSTDITQIRVNDTRQAVGLIAAALFDFPSLKLNLVGVTGTNGKTTVTHLVEKIAQMGGKQTGLIGTLGARIADRELPGNHTTPESTEVQKLLYDMVNSKVDVAVMEVSSHALDLGRVNGCRFNAGIFTNLSQDHLDYHRDMKDYLHAKSLLFSGMNQDGNEQFAVINADDNAADYLKQKAACRVVTYAVDSDADYKAKGIKLSDKGVEFDVYYRNSKVHVFFSTPGKFSVYNALAAFAWAIEAKYPLDVVVQALAEIKGVPGRFQSIRKGQPFLVIVDYAHTPDGLENVLETAREITQGKLITVFGCGGDRDRTKRPLMGEVASRWSDSLVVTSDNPRTEDPDQIIADIIPGLGGVQYMIIADRRKAITYACSIASSGDTIVIAGKGHEDYQILGTEKIYFDDREEVEIALRGIGYVD